MRTNEELEIEIEYLRGVISHLQNETELDFERLKKRIQALEKDKTELDFKRLKKRIQALEKAELDRQAHEVTK